MDEAKGATGVQADGEPAPDSVECPNCGIHLGFDDVGVVMFS